MATIQEMMDSTPLEDIIKSNDLEFLNNCRLYFETTEEFEKCALIRDKIKIIKDARPKSIKVINIPK